MFNTPLEALTHVVERMKCHNPALPVTREYLLELIAPFLANRDRHREYADAILKLAELAGRLGATSAALRYFNQSRLDHGRQRRRRRTGTLAINHRALTGHMLAIREDLFRSITPAQISCDALPTKRCAVDETWQRHDRNAHEIDLRVGVRSVAGFRVSHVSIEMQLNGSDGIQIVDARPSDSLEVIADRETTIAYSTKAGATNSRTANLAIGQMPILLSGSIGRAHSDNHETERSSKQTQKDRAVLQKVVCVAVGTTAVWDIYETPVQMPPGTITPSVTFLAPATLETVECVIRVSVKVAGFDAIELRDRRTCTLIAA